MLADLLQTERALKRLKSDAVSEPTPTNGLHFKTPEFAAAIEQLIVDKPRRPVSDVRGNFVGSSSRKAGGCCHMRGDQRETSVMKASTASAPTLSQLQKTLRVRRLSVYLC
jgi:hypothetical protein